MKETEKILKKFINFLKKFFKNGEQKQIPAKTEVVIHRKPKSNFFDELRVYREDDILLKLQEQYEKSEIDF